MREELRSARPPGRGCSKMLALILLAQLAATPTSPPPTATPVRVVPGRPRTLADVARERKLGNGPKAGAFSVSGAEGAPSGSSVASRRGCDKLDEKLAELRRSDMSSEQWSRAKKRWDELATACAEVSTADDQLAAAKSTAAKALRDIAGTQLSSGDADLLRSRAASNNQTVTVDRSGKKHTSEQLVFPGVGHVYLRDGYVESVQIQ
jgi:hypothetical protein